MAWFDSLPRVTHPDGRKLIGASFRGVAFFVATAMLSTGRRLAVHEFPQRDEPAVDDLGRRARAFPVEGYVLGDDYLTQQAALLAALEDRGPGELVHPYYGRRRASCSNARISTTVREGRMARFSLEFIEEPLVPPSPLSAPVLGELVTSAAPPALLALQAQAEETFDADGQPSFALESVEADTVSVAEELQALLEPVVNAAGELSGEAETATQELAGLQAATLALVADAVSLARSPTNTLEAFTAILGAITETAATAPRQVLLALLDAQDVPPPPLAAGTTPTRDQERVNQAAMADAIRGQLLVVAGGLLVEVDYQTQDDALSDRDAVVSRLDAAMATATDTAFPELLDLRSAVQQAIPGSLALARVVEVERREATPSILLSYQLYGTTTHEDQILTRNPAQHPGFLSGTLEVLST